MHLVGTGTHCSWETALDDDRTPVVRIVGEIDCDTGPRLCLDVPAMVRAAGTDPEIVHVDLSHVGFVDCAGMTALLRIRADIALCCRRAEFVSPSPVVRRLWDLLGMASVFDTAS